MALSLDLFNKLSSKDVKARAEATSLLLRSLDSDEDIRYTLGRLTKGVASGREDSRIGFSVALTELLAREYTGKADLALDAIVANTTLRAKGSGQEERDYNFGRLFGLQSIVKSGILVDKSVNLNTVETILTELLRLSGTKGWIKETCAWIILDLVKSFATIDRQDLFAIFQERLINDLSMVKTPEGIAYYLLLNGSAISAGDGRNDSVSKNNPLNKSNLHETAKILKGNSADSAETGKGTWKPKLHFAWNIILAQYAASERSFDSSFRHFWSIVVDDGLFNATSSLERKFWGLRLFERAVETLPDQCFPSVLSRNFLRCLMNHLSDSERYLHKAAKKAASLIAEYASNHPDKASSVAEHLLTRNGSVYFDRITKTKTVETVCASGSPSEVQKTLDLLISLFFEHKKNEDVKAVETARSYLLDLMANFLRNKHTVKEFGSTNTFVRFCAEYGFLQENKKGRMPVSDSTRAAVRARLMTFLTSLSAQLRCEMTSESVVWPSVALNHILERMDSAGSILAVTLSESAQQSIKKTAKTFHKLRAKREREHDLKVVAFDLLLSLLLLQSYSDEKDAIDVLPELRGFYKDFFPKKSHQKSDKSSTIETLVDLLLMLLSKPSLLLRKTVEIVWEGFASSMTADGLQLLYNVILTRENEGATSELFDQGSENSDYEEEDLDDSPDGELSNSKRKVSVLEMSDASFSSNDDSGGDDDDADESLEKAVAQALGTQDAEEEGSDDEISLHDEDMMAVDEHLSKIFAERKKKSNAGKEKKQAKEQTIAFKSKTIDLIDIYVRSQQSNPLVLNLILPLLDAFEYTSTKSISDKIVNIIQNRLVKVQLHESHCADTCLRILERIHQKTRENTSVPSSCLNQCCMLLVRTIASNEEQKLEDVYRLYASSFFEFTTSKKVKFQAGFFSDLVNWAAQWRQKSR